VREGGEGGEVEIEIIVAFIWFNWRVEREWSRKS